MHDTPAPRITPEVLARLRAWEGRSETLDDTVTAAPVHGLAATLDRDDAAAACAALPPLWHWLYFLPRAPQRDLGTDGHPRLGGFLARIFWSLTHVVNRTCPARAAAKPRGDGRCVVCASRKCRKLFFAGTLYIAC